MDINQILQQNNLMLVESNYFNKEHIFRVADSSGRKMILKTHSFNSSQIKLLEIAKSLELELCFKVPEIVKYEKEYIILEEINGNLLNAESANNLDKYIEISKNISDDYQKVIEEYLKTEGLGGLLELGSKWLFEKLDQWSQPIIDNGLVDKARIEELKIMFLEKVENKGEEFFGWAHGNIIGDHVVANKKGEYLLDLEILPRPGKNYYDFLRSLDWIFLKSDKLSFDKATDYMAQYLTDFDSEDVKLVFAFRCIGILGWDMLKNGDLGEGDSSQKKRDLVRFIKMKY